MSIYSISSRSFVSYQQIIWNRSALSVWWWWCVELHHFSQHICWHSEQLTHTHMASSIGKWHRSWSFLVIRKNCQKGNAHDTRGISKRMYAPTSVCAWLGPNHCLFVWPYSGLGQKYSETRQSLDFDCLFNVVLHETSWIDGKYAHRTHTCVSAWLESIRVQYDFGDRIQRLDKNNKWKPGTSSSMKATNILVQ